jgi:hypothetical protein
MTDREEVKDVFEEIQNKKGKAVAYDKYKYKNDEDFRRKEEAWIVRQKYEKGLFGFNEYYL